MDAVEVAGHQDEFARQHVPAEHLQRAEEHGGRRAEGGDDLRRASGRGFEPGNADGFQHGFGGDLVKLFLLVSLARERLHQRDGREHFGHARRHLAFLALLFFDRGLGLAIEKKQAEAEERQRGQRDQADPPVEHEHDGEHADDLQRLRGELQNGLGENVLQGVGVAGDLGHEVAGARVIVERKREPLQVREQLAAQRVNHFVAEGRGDENLRVGKQPAAGRDQNNGHRGGDDEQNLVPFERARKQTHPARQVFVQDGVINDDLERPGLEQVGGDDAQRA